MAGRKHFDKEANDFPNDHDKNRNEKNVVPYNQINDAFIDKHGKRIKECETQIKKPDRKRCAETF